MAVQPARNVLSCLGLVYSGDIGQLTVYRSKRGKLVVFKKTWPKEIPSAEQTVLRAKFTAAAEAWKALTPQARAQWELATRRTSLCMHGYDLFVHHQLVGDDMAIKAIERQSQTTLLPP